MEMANPLLESFGESPKACVTNSNRPPANLKGKANPEGQRARSAIGLFKLLAS